MTTIAHVTELDFDTAMAYVAALLPADARGWVADVMARSLADELHELVRTLAWLHSLGIARAIRDAAACGALDDAPLTVEVPSASKVGVAYTVALDGSRCSCPGFTFRGYCKHVAPSRRAA